MNYDYLECPRCKEDGLNNIQTGLICFSCKKYYRDSFAEYILINNIKVINFRKLNESSICFYEKDVSFNIRNTTIDNNGKEAIVVKICRFDFHLPQNITMDKIKAYLVLK